MSEALEAARAMKRQLAGSLQESRQKVRRLQQRAASERRADKAEWVLAGPLLRTALLVYAIAGNLADPAALYLEEEAKRKGWADKGLCEIGRMVEDEFLAVDDLELATWRCADDASDLGILRAATKWVEGWRLGRWTASQNRVARVAPASRRVYGEYELQRAALSEAVRPPAWGVRFNGSARKAATRWRRRFGGRLSVLRPRDIIPLSEMREKATLNHGSHITYCLFGFCPPLPFSCARCAFGARSMRGCC